MRPSTLAEAVERVRAGEPQDVALAEFLDDFLSAGDSAAKFAGIEKEPALTGDARLDALVGAMAEYLAKQHRLGRVPKWASTPSRHLPACIRSSRYPKTCAPFQLVLQVLTKVIAGKSVAPDLVPIEEELVRAPAPTVHTLRRVRPLGLLLDLERDVTQLSLATGLVVGHLG